MRIIVDEDVDSSGEFDHKTVLRMNLVALQYLRNETPYAEAMAIAFDEVVAPEIGE